ncbi:MAG TPA: tRNA uracil 4-sulfurtransferase ThiI [Vicinamibacterales bacterium]|nr:tRNA uracil 4-sulfurtransferase ThiI [Vicinamibacterales bacterium]
MRSIVIHYNEIALKGRNRPYFVARLVRNLREATKDAGVPFVRVLNGRFEMELAPGADIDEVRDRVSRVFGVGNYARAGRTGVDLDQIGREIIDGLKGRPDPASFRIAARRADKRHAMTSVDIERHIGAMVQAATGWKVDLGNPALTINVEMLGDETFYSFGKEKGAGGLPTGVSGRVACLLSGGIDSPVAAWRMMRRGCRVYFIHFHSYPVLSRASQEKAVELARLLTQWQLHSRLFLVPFADIQQKALMTVDPALRVVVYRRLMVRIAEQIARRVRAQALVTGEVIGQVASQTLENMTVIDAASAMPVLRPLVGMDKEEIVEAAKALGSYPISIIPDQDCCTLFTPKHPATRASIGQIEEAERALDAGGLIEAAMAAAVVQDFEFPVIKSTA